MAARYAIKSRKANRASLGQYVFALVDLSTPQPNDWGYRVVTTMRGNNPINAPKHLTQRQAELNTASVLDGQS